MGGTTAKLCVIEDGRAADRARVRGRPRLPPAARLGPADQDRRSIDMIEIGVGRRLDRPRRRARASLTVGPDSAGSDPGPGLLRRSGGAEPTVTDADLVLGYLDPGLLPRRPDGARRRRRATRRSSERIADPLGLTRRGGRLGHPPTSSTRTWPTPRACTRSSAARTRRPAAVRVRRRGPGARVRRRAGARARPSLVAPPAAGVMSSDRLPHGAAGVRLRALGARAVSTTLAWADVDARCRGDGGGGR